MPQPRLVLALFLLAQFFDGLFTYVAVLAYGIEAEGNQIIAGWMALAGPGPTIVGAKLVASAAGVLLYSLEVYRTLAFLTVFYGVAAILPWLLIYATIV